MAQIPCKTIKNQGSVLLRFSSTNNYSFDRSSARIFEQGVPQVLFPFNAVQASPSSVDVHFDVTRLVTLEEYLKTPLDRMATERLLLQMKQLIDSCISLKLPMKNILFDFKQVYYDSWASTLRFIYLPFTGIAPDIAKVQKFYVDVSKKARPTDGSTQSLLLQYSSFVTSLPNFDPLAISDFLGSVTMNVPNPVMDMKRAREKNAEQMDPLKGRAIHSRPASSKNRAFETHEDDEEPLGTTVLNAVSFGVDLDDKSHSHGGWESTSASAENGHERHGKQSDREGFVSFTTNLKPAVAQPAEPVADIPDTDVLGDSEYGEIDEKAEPQMPAWLAESQATAATVAAEPEAPAATPTVAQAPTVAPAVAQAPVAFVAMPTEPQETAQPEKPKVRYWLIHMRSGDRVEVTDDNFVVGKSKYSSYQVRGTTTVSRSHALFFVDSEGCSIEDDDSRNGTFINNRRIESHDRKRLESGDKIRMSDEEFKFEATLG